ncbi:hypothetical protein B7494_g1504 [Chlorociboria aeruginascens]|nr:hypothetical protein B7494_g1504 [Chlorociboria aeruginascens]
MPQRGPRNAPTGPRGNGRGRIQKRRTGPARVDKDGDLVMDPSITGERRKPGRGRPEISLSSMSQVSRGGTGASSSRGRLGTRAQQGVLKGLQTPHANIIEHPLSTGGTTLRIDGLKSSKASSNPDGGLESLLAFLERKGSGLDAKSNRTVKIKKSHIEGDSVIITASPEDTATILKLDGFMFAQSALFIRPCEKPSPPRPNKPPGTESADAQEIRHKIRDILSNRYNVELKLLNLSALREDPRWVEMGSITNSPWKLFAVLMRVCDEFFTSSHAKRDAIMSVTLADNQLSDISVVNTLAQTFPDLKNLDLSQNRLADLRSLSAWRLKFRWLENLVLTGNPIETLSPDNKIEIIKWFPTLQTLDGLRVRSAEEVALAIEASKSPIPVSGPDFRDVAQVGENFIRQFINLYDSDRMTLLASFYDAESLHSFSINMSAPRDPSNFVPIPPWTAYTKFARNMVRVTHLNTRMSRQYRGTHAIRSVWNELPGTRHPDLSTKADQYLIECHPIAGLSDPTRQSPRGVDGLILTLHGEFEEVNSSSSDKALRSFSRTFVLGPGAPGGPQIRVISDIYVLRGWAPLATPSKAANGPASMPNPEQQNQEVVTMQLVERTGMTPNYAVLCLTETGWDLEKAYMAFDANKLEYDMTWQWMIRKGAVVVGHEADIVGPKGQKGRD